MYRFFAATLALASGACGEISESPYDDAPEVPSGVADTYAVTSAARLLFFERASGQIQSALDITGLGAGESILGIDFRPADAALYALSSSGKLYVIDRVSGAASLKSSLATDPADTSSPFAELAGDVFGVNFNPVADRLRVVSDAGQNLRINVDTGATTTDDALNPGTPSVTAAAYTNGFAAACRTRLYVLDTSVNELLLQDPPNAGTLSQIGQLTAPRGNATWAGFEIITSPDAENQGLVLLPAANGATLYDLDLTSAELVAPRTLALGAGETLRGLSAAPPQTAPAQAPGEILGVSVNDRLISFNRAAPGKPCTQVPITGLMPNEDVLGIDIRPADGALYALGSAGHIYTIRVATGAATLKSTLSADPTDTSAPFAGLAPGEHGLGFNPVPDRLRAVGRNGDNLRINVDTGVTVTDAPLSPSSMAVTAVAYTNARAGATSTTLYAVDTGSGALIRIGGDPATAGACPDDADNPNCGSVISLGPLGVADMSSVGGFDIDGDPSATGSALVVLSRGNATSSSLYVLDLASGAAAPPAGVANPSIGGGERLREITFATNPSNAPAP
jgi:uncharacterized protein DUF4394